MKNYRTLQVLDKFSGVFHKFGVDYDAMRKILQVKLTIDARTPSLIIATSERSVEKESNQFLRSLWFYGLFGLLSSLMLLGDNYLFQMSLFFGMFMFMLLTVLISSFSSILLDVRDRNILFSKPVSRRTLAMAKTMHVLIYMFFLTGAMVIVPLLVGLYKHGILFSLLLLITIILIDLFSVVATALVYLTVLRFFDGEKLKDMINYVQIGLTVGITIGYQLLVRLFGIVDTKVVFESRWWQFFIPPIWFGAVFETILEGVQDQLFVIFVLLAVVVPIVSFIIYLKLLPTLERYVQKLAAPSVGKSRSRNWVATFLATISCRNQIEKVFFHFTWAMIKKERKFKLKVYPSVGLSLVFPFIFLFSMGSKSLDSLQGSPKFALIYFCAMLIPTYIIMIRYSDKHKGAWIYEVTPVQDKTIIYKSMIKASFFRLVMPIYILVSVAFAYLFGLQMIPDLIAVLLTLVLYTVLTFMYFEKTLPFSKPFDVGQQAEGVKVVPIMLVLFLLAMWHLGMMQFGYGTYLHIGILLILNVVVWKLGFSKKVLLHGVNV